MREQQTVFGSVRVSESPSPGPSLLTTTNSEGEGESGNMERNGWMEGKEGRADKGKKRSAASYLISSEPTDWISVERVLVP